MKKIVGQFSDWSGVNVVTQAYYSKSKKILILWILFIILMTIICLFLVVQKIFSKNYGPKILTSRKTSNTFPNFIICFDTKYTYENFDKTGIDKDKDTNNYDNYFTDSLRYSSFRDAKTYVRNLRYVYNISKLTYNCVKNSICTEYLIIQSSYQGHNYKKILKLINNEVVKYKNCLMFDFKNINFAYYLRAGKDFSFSLMIKNEISDIENHYRKGIGYNPILEIRYSLFNNIEGENFDFHSNMVPLGYETNIPIVISKENRDKNLSKCYTSNYENKKNYYLLNSYTLKSCFMNCLRDNEINDCGKTTPFPPDVCNEIGHECNCITNDCLNCSSYSLFPERMKNNIFKKKFIEKCLCEFPCNYIEFSTSTSFLKLHPKNVANMFNLKDDTKYLKTNIEANYAIINFYIKEMEILVKDEILISSSTNLISDIGNNLSLLLGLGVINFIEILLCIIVICYYKISLYLKKNT